MEYSDLSGQISDTDHSLSASVKLEKKTSCNQQPSCELISPVDNESNSNGVVKMERPLSPCEAMDTNNNNNENQSVSQSQSQTKTPKDLKSGNNSPTKYNSAANGEFKQPGGSSHKSMGITQGGLISPEFRTETPVSSSALFNVPTSALFALEGLDFNTPVGSGQATPLASARFSRKRQLSISPLSSSSIDLNSLIRTSPTSLVNYITNSRGSSAGSMGHLSPSFFSKPTRLQTPHGRPLQISLRNSGYPHPNQLESSIEQSTRSENMDLLMNIKEEHSEEFIANGQNLSSNSMQSIKMEHDIPPRRDTLHQGNTLETVREESVGAFSDDEGHLNDTRGYPLVDPDSEMDTKIGILDSKNKRVYYNYPSVEDPHNNQCKWGECTHQCDTLESLVQHVNNEHIYRDSRKEFVCYWNGCVREKKPSKAQYMLLVHMRRHTGEKPHKCTYDGCNKAYSRLENLKTHLRSHTGEKPYVCKYEGCSKAFSNASDCAKHMNRTHTDEKPYACPNPGCTKRYTDPSSRRKHVKNCQVNKRARTGEADAMSGGEDETEPKPTTTSSRKPKPRKPDKRKQNVPPPIPQSVNAFAPVHPQLSGGGMSLTDHGYFSGGSQSYNGSQLSYNSMQEGESEYPKQRGDEEISHILQQQRLSDSNDVTTTMQQSSIGLAMSSPAGLPSNDHISDCINPNVRASRQNGGGLQTLPAGSIQPSPPPTQLQHIHSPSYLSSTHSKYSQFPTHGNQPTSSIRTPNLMGNPATTQHNPYTNGRRTNLNGVSTNRKSPSDDSSVLSGSLRSSLMNNSLSTFSSNSSRVSSPCSTNGRGELIRPHPQFVQMNDVRYSMKQGFSPRDSYSRRHNSDTWSERSWKSSQSSRYSFSSELSDDFLENLPSSARKYGFSKVPPLPLPESMHDEFSGMDYGNGTMEEHGMMDFLPSQQIPNGDTNLFLSQIQPDNLGQSNSDPLATLPLYHLDGNTTAMDVTNVNNAFSATVQTGLFSQEAPNEEIDMIYNDLPYTASTSNMMMGDMSSFVHALSEETQYFEQMLSSRVK